jgi:methyl-accepting chemotaxis protein
MAEIRNRSDTLLDAFNGASDTVEGVNQRLAERGERAKADIAIAQETRILALNARIEAARRRSPGRASRSSRTRSRGWRIGR